MKLASLPAGGPSFRRRRLVSLWWLMKRFDVVHMLKVTRMLEGADLLGQMTKHGPVILPAQEKSFHERTIRDLKPTLEELGLQASAVTCGKLLESLGSPLNRKRFGALSAELSERMIDELQNGFLLHLSPDEAAHYQHPLSGWEPATDRFPSAVGEIEEASKCFALSRYAACAFHLMRALEPVLRAIADELVIVKHKPTWDAYLGAMKDAVQLKYPAKNKADADKREYFAGVESH